MPTAYTMIQALDHEPAECSGRDQRAAAPKQPTTRSWRIWRSDALSSLVGGQLHSFHTWGGSSVSRVSGVVRAPVCRACGGGLARFTYFQFCVFFRRHCVSTSSLLKYDLLRYGFTAFPETSRDCTVLLPQTRGPRPWPRQWSDHTAARHPVASGVPTCRPAQEAGRPGWVRRAIRAVELCVERTRGPTARPSTTSLCSFQAFV